MSGILLSLLVFAAAVLLQALFAGYETGFVSCNPIRISFLADKEKVKRAGHLLRYMERPDQMLTTLLIGTNTAVVVSTIVVARSVQPLFPEDTAGALKDLVSLVIVAPVLLVCSEIIPKSVFRTHPNRLCLAFLPVIRFFYTLLAPIAVPVSWATRFCLRAVGGKTEHISPYMSTLEDVRVLIDEGVDHGTIEREEQEMIHSVMDLQTTHAKEITVPRIDIQALPDAATRRELVTLFEESGRTRIPIYHETIDTIVGVVNAYDVLTDAEPENEDIKRFIKEVMHVPDTMKVDDLFKALKDAKQHLAIVTDEYGGTDGLITIEDIIEEIFGEIQDEYDNEEHPIRQVGPDAYVVDARMELEHVSDRIGVRIHDEEVETVGGWLMRVAGRIPAVGEDIQHRGFRMTVLDGSPSHIEKIRMELSPEARRQDGEEGQREQNP